MKKTVKLISAACLILMGGVLYAKGYSISNSFGGDSEALEGQDFFTLGRSYDPELNGYVLNNNSMQVSDRLQLEAEGDVVETKIRLDLFDSVITSDDEESAIPNVKLKGYGLVNFNDYISLVIGNSFFSKFDVKGAELFAADTLPKYGKILRNGAGLYGTVPLSSDGKVKLNLGGGIEYKSDFSDLAGLKADFGAVFQMRKLFSAGVTAQNFTALKDGRYGVFASAKISDFKVNAGFIYNCSDKDILKVDAECAAALSGKYSNDNLGLQIALDVVSGLFSHDVNAGIPLFAAFDASYKLNEKTKIALNVMYKDQLYTTNSNYLLQVYPNAGYSSKSGKYSVNGGLKLYFEETTVKGLTRLSIPVVCKVVFNDK